MHKSRTTLYALSLLVCLLILVGGLFGLHIITDPGPPAPLAVPSTASGTQVEQGGWGSFIDMMLSLLPLSPKGEEIVEVPVVLAIIENHEDARPYQAGLSDAVMVFELIVEGDITRFMALFRGDRLPDAIGPVRSLRAHFLSIARAYSPLLLHIGGSKSAYALVQQLTTITNHDGIYYDGQTYYRSKETYAPHNLFMGKEALVPLIQREQEKLVAQRFPLYESTKKRTEGVEAQTIVIDFSSPLHNVTYTYAPEEKQYVRSIHNNVQQSIVHNVLVLETDVEGYGARGAIPWTQTFGEGAGQLFQYGRMVPIRWGRGREGMFAFVNEEGDAVPLAPGQTWITMVPFLNQVSWE